MSGNQVMKCRKKKMNVLLVENEFEIRSLLKSTLESRGHQVADYADGASGWAAYQVQNFPMVIVDCSLPEMAGLELSQKIRGTPKGYGSLILVVTARSRFGTLGQVLAAGADDYLEIPLDLQHLNIRLAIAEQRISALLKQVVHIESLREKEQRWNRALEGGRYSVWDWNLQTGEVTYSMVGKAIIGYTNNEIGNNLTEWESLIHPDDKPQWTEALRTFFHDKADKLSIEYRIRCKGGRWQWMLTHGTVASRAGNGLVLRVIGMHSDITAQKNSAQELQFADAVYEAIGEAVMITDSNDRITAVNQAFTKLSGYAPDEVVGKSASFMCSERHGESFNPLVGHKLNTTGIWEGEIWNRRKDGEEYAVWQMIHTVYDDDGNVLKRVALFSNVTEQKRIEENIRRQAYYDLLTGLPNRRLFHDRLGMEIRKANRANLSIALLFIDLDYFKEVNDTLGHDVGDILLQEIARRISTCVRESDTVARLGGDEFTVILPELPDARHIDDVAQKIVSKLAEPYNIGEKIVNVSASVGITLYPTDANGISALMKNADQAMYVAKSKGRNQFSHFSVSLPTAEQTRGNLINDLRGAVSAGQLLICFQPIVELPTGCIHKAEALLRWNHPAHGIISPMEFIPLAEESGLINQIGDWVFKESARYAKQWSHKFDDDFQVSINISSAQFKTGHNYFSAEWLQHLQGVGLSGKNMAVEICEELLNAEPDIMDKLRAFHDAGIQVSIDDFGTDYSSLSKYKKFNIDYLKIDQSFILDFANDPNDLALSEIIVMAHQLGFKMIAEGVETEGQRDLLVAAGCDYAQGNLYSKPILPEEFEALLLHGFNAHQFNLQPKAKDRTISELTDHSMLTIQEAATFLQPHMPSKSVNVWLAHDRQHDPIIPFFLVQGQPYYLESDLANFVTRRLNPSAHFIQLNNRLNLERRNSLDRRKQEARRLIADNTTQQGIKRRRRDDLGLNHYTILERRANKSLDRRDRSSRTMH
jgi:diguanylate cyclase (GGDEF)-like protein/PAS domain S-box-containing protein